jgi:hypothetical protein
MSICQLLGTLMTTLKDVVCWTDPDCAKTVTVSLLAAIGINLKTAVERRKKGQLSQTNEDCKHG